MHVILQIPLMHAHETERRKTMLPTQQHKVQLAADLSQDIAAMRQGHTKHPTTSCTPATPVSPRRSSRLGLRNHISLNDTKRKHSGTKYEDTYTH